MMQGGRYCFVEDERPTVRVPAPEPTDQELRDRLRNTENQIALLMQRRARILERLAKKEG